MRFGLKWQQRLCHVQDGPASGASNCGTAVTSMPSIDAGTSCRADADELVMTELDIADANDGGTCPRRQRVELGHRAPHLVADLAGSCRERRSEIMGAKVQRARFVGMNGDEHAPDLTKANQTVGRVDCDERRDRKMPSSRADQLG